MTECRSIEATEVTEEMIEAGLLALIESAGDHLAHPIFERPLRDVAESVFHAMTLTQRAKRGTALSTPSQEHRE